MDLQIEVAEKIQRTIGKKVSIVERNKLFNQVGVAFSNNRSIKSKSLDVERMLKNSRGLFQEISYKNFENSWIIIFAHETHRPTP